VIFEPGKKYEERDLMQMAIRVARLSIEEPNPRHPPPKVGAVIARNGYVLATGFRGEKDNGRGAHAEESALAKISSDVARDADVFTTLEPCTKRGSHTPCTDLLRGHHVGRVVIGILDPNRDIRGQGEWELEDAKIKIGKFDPDLVDEIRAINREFIDYQLGLGFTINDPQANSLIQHDPIGISGTFRTHPVPGDIICVFVLHGTTYWPQSPITYNRKEATWACSPVWLKAHPAPPRHYTILVARCSDDFGVALRHYSEVAAETKKAGNEQWIGLNMPTLPSGLEVLASVRVVRAPIASGR
jgi:pyrimidine deaminase RibD-like protein